jgi:small subunit ribosomal protein S6
VNRDYELGVILSPEASEEETRAIMDRVEQVIANHGGQIVRVNQWGRRRLAYPIQRHRDGIYVFIDMILTPETVSELERTLKVSETVLRHMVKKRDPKVAQKEREEHEARAAAAPVPAAPEAKAEEPGLASEEVEEIPALSEEDLQDVPPAIEEPLEA